MFSWIEFKSSAFATRNYSSVIALSTIDFSRLLVSIGRNDSGYYLWHEDYTYD